jgi:hypothetical protein
VNAPKGVRTARWVNYELYGFANGNRMAWVTYEAEMPLGERRCIKVSELSRADAEAP